jgi:hypothetical protein
MAFNRLLSRNLDHMRKIITYDKGAENNEHILVTTLFDIQSCSANRITARKRAQCNMPLVSSGASCHRRQIL